MFDTFPSLQTNSLHLVEISQEHLGDLFQIFSDSRITRYYNVETLQTESEGQRILDWFRSRFAERVGIRWGLCVKGEKNIIGTIGYNHFTKHHRASIGYDLQHAHWGRVILQRPYKL